MIAPDGQVFSSVNVLEVRACANGFVISVMWAEAYCDGPLPVRGYETVVVESHSPEQVGAAVARVLAQHKLDPAVRIGPARRSP